MKKFLICMLAVILAMTLVTAVACSQHNWSKEWSKNATQHWHECLDDDGEKTDVADHIDVDNNGKCDVCDYQLKPDTPPTPTDKVTVYYYNSDFWEQVKAYAYNAGEEKLLGEWPGTAATAVSGHDNWFSVEVEANPTTDAFNIIFNNGITTDDGKAQAADIVIDNATDVYLLNRSTNNKFASFETAEQALNDHPVTTEEIKVHFHKPDNWGNSVNVYVYYDSDGAGENPAVEFAGGWPGKAMTAGTDGWYSVSFNVTEGQTATGVNVIIFDAEADGNRIEPVVNKAEVYVVKTGEIFETKEAAEAFESAVKVAYTFYYYAPDWTAGEAVYLYTYGTLTVNGDYNGTTMTTVEDHDGWYSFTYETATEFDNISVIFHTLDENITKHEFHVDGLTGTNFYFIDNAEQVFTDMQAAEAKYNEIKDAPPAENMQVTVHVHKPDAWVDLFGHGYGSTGDLTGAFGTFKPTADSEHDGWYTFVVTAPQTLIGEDAEGFTLMLFDIVAEEGRNVLSPTIKASESWVANDGSVFASYAEATAHEGGGMEVTNTYTIYFYAPDTTGAVTASVWGNMAGAFDDNTAMTAVEGHEGWYQLTFTTDKDISGGLNLNFYIDGEYSCGDYTTDANWVYFIKGINDGKCGSFADAEAKYNEQNA